MIINPLSAINGLGALAEIGGKIGGAAVAAQGTAPLASFASALGNAASEAIDGLRGAEKLSFDALQGKGDTRAVVDAVMSAEQSLQAAIAIRDKIVTAYLEVSRMAI